MVVFEPAKIRYNNSVDRMSNVDNKLITSKSSSKHEVEFHDVKIKKGSILRTEVLPLSNQKEIKEAELTITQDVLDRINKRNGQKVITIYCR